MVQDSLQLSCLLLGAVAASLWLCQRFSWAKRASPLLWILGFCALASNTHVIPTEHPLYGQVTGFCVPFAVCLVLFGVRLDQFKALGRSMLLAFALASTASLVGVVCASVALSTLLESSIGLEHWKLAGPYAGTYVGGSLNFFSLWEGLQIRNPDLFAAANAVDNLSILPLMMVWTTAPRWLARAFEPQRHLTGEPANEPPPPTTSTWKSEDIAILSAAALAVMVSSRLITQHWIAPFFPEVPNILVVTTLALILGQFGFIRERQGAWELGNLAFYLFFAAVGASINILATIELSPILFAYVAIVFMVHMTVLFGAGRLLKLDLASLIIASVATKGGPALVPSVAQSQGWNWLVLPGILLGLLGYALGNYLGFGTAYLVRALVSP